MIELHGSSLLQNTCKTVLQVASPVVVVGGPNQPLPELPRDVLVVRDSTPFPGPLSAIHTGYQMLKERIPEMDRPQSSVWVCGCDTPFVTVEIINSVWASQRNELSDSATLTESGRMNPLLAVYRLETLSQMAVLCQAGQMRADALLKIGRCVSVPVDNRKASEGPSPTTNLNTPKDLNALRHS